MAGHASNAKHEEQEPAAATRDQRQQNREHGFPGRRFMGPGDPDAFRHDAPDAGNRAPAKRNHHERLRGATGETDDAKSSFERPVRSAHQHEAKVQDRRANKKTDGENDWDENEKKNQK